MMSHSPDVVGLLRDLTHGITDSTSKVGGGRTTPLWVICVCTLQLAAQWGDIVHRYTHAQPTGRILQSTICICSNTELHLRE